MSACTSVDRAQVPRPVIAAPSSAQEALVAIALLEDARHDGEGLLQDLAGTPGSFGPDVRERALLALGRLPAPAAGQPSGQPHTGTITAALLAGLTDESASARAMAAFSLGLRADPAAADGMLARWLDPEPEVRVRLVQAAGRIDEPRLHAKVLSSLRSPLEGVRRMAAIAPHAWSTADDDARQVDLALAQLAGQLPLGDPRAERLGIPSSGLEQPEVLWRALFTLARRKAEAGRDAFHVHRADEDPLARLYSVKGLAGIELHDAGRLALEQALSDPDWRVAVEAAGGLGLYGDRRSLDALAAGCGHDSVHVRTAVAEALTRFKVEQSRAAELLKGLRDDFSPGVRAAGLSGEAALRGARVLPLLERSLESGDAVLRAGAVLAAGRLADRQALDLLLAASHDWHPRVAGIAVQALATRDDPAVHARLLELLAGEDNGLRVAAASALEQHPRAEDLGALEAAFRSSTGDVGVDVQTQVLRTVAAIDTDDARAFLDAAREHAHPWVRRVADELTDAAPRGYPADLDGPAPDLPLPGRDYDPSARPRVVIITERGRLVFELFPVEAPVHVHSFLTLARAGHYDGLDFHRVVGDFVVQGGCYRGDGNGTGTWRGQDDALRQELYPRAYVRGSLGMPRSSELDSGGSQFFVNHRPTPHLDGRYTIFGELREGFEVLDRIEVGDLILGIEFP